jgi:hypothetical protein
VLQQQWANASTGEKSVALGAAVTVAAWLLGVVVNGIWWDVAGAQTLGLVAVLAAVVVLVVIAFNGASNGALPGSYGTVLLVLAGVVIVFVALAAWSVFSLNTTMGTFKDCVSGGATSSACAKVANFSINDVINELRLTADSAGVGQESVATGGASLSSLVSFSSSNNAIPSMPISTWVAAVGLIAGAACMAWGSFQQWTTGKTNAA